MPKTKRLPVKEGWYSSHPLTDKRVVVVPGEWATAHIDVYREAIQLAIDSGRLDAATAQVLCEVLEKGER